MLDFLFGAPFNPEKDIPSLSGKTILVTGGNNGLGKEQLRFLAVHGGSPHLVLAARNAQKADAAIQDLKSSAPNAHISFLELDLASLESVKAAAEKFKAENERLDVLVNNAGIMAHGAGLTKDGYETQFGTNHVGHFLFTMLLMPLLQATASKPNADVRIINLSSAGHNFAPAGGFVPDAVKTDMSTYNTWSRYGQSKLANILFTRELARRYPAITSVAIHPGGVNTGLTDELKKNHPWLGVLVGSVSSLLLKSTATGALNQTWASVAEVEGRPETKGSSSSRKVKQGAYYSPVAKEGSGESKLARDAELARKLWEWSESEMKSKGYLS